MTRSKSATVIPLVVNRGPQWEIAEASFSSIVRVLPRVAIAPLQSCAASGTVRACQRTARGTAAPAASPPPAPASDARASGRPPWRTARPSGGLDAVLVYGANRSRQRGAVADRLAGDPRGGGRDAPAAQPGAARRLPQPCAERRRGSRVDCDVAAGGESTAATVLGAARADAAPGGRHRLGACSGTPGAPRARRRRRAGPGVRQAARGARAPRSSTTCGTRRG